MKLLKNIPGFLSEMQWNDHRNSFHTLNPIRIFAENDLFIIPPGTLVERFSYQGMELTRFVYPFSFFTLMEQFTISLTSNRFELGSEWNCYENVSNMVQIGYKFITDILKNYQGNFKSDTTLRRLVHHLEILSAQISENSPKRYEFVKLYFELNSTIINYKLLTFSEAFPQLIQKKLFPQALICNNINKQIVFNQIHNGSILLRNLKQEESKSDHSLLLLYLKLIQDMIEVNILFTLSFYLGFDNNCICNKNDRIKYISKIYRNY